MPATAERQQLTEILLDEIRGRAFPSSAQLDRIERLISTREELEDYMAILTEKVQGTKFPAGHMLDRLERLLGLLQRLDRETQSKR